MLIYVSDQESCLHPKIKESLKRKECTGVVTGTTAEYGQFLYYCTTCRDYSRAYCASCKDEIPAHRGHQWTQGFTFGGYCARIDPEKPTEISSLPSTRCCPNVAENGGAAGSTTPRPKRRRVCATE
jgi:hypothetical protein